VGSTKAHELLQHIVEAGASTVDEPTRTQILELEEVMRKTSICGLGQVALGPVVSVMGFTKGGAMAAEQAQSTTPTS
jgi:formate dehydrogenase/NADH-quinone oxidoreductase subunit F